MLEVVELEAYHPEEINNAHQDDEASSLLSGLTNHTRENPQQPPFLTMAAFASPYGKMLNSMKASATLRRRESLGRAACGIGAVILLVILMGWLLWISIISNRHDTTPPHRQTNATQHVDSVSFLLLPRSSSSPSSPPPLLLQQQQQQQRPPPPPVVVDIVVQMSGEMGNHLSKLASGIGASLYLRELGISSNLRLRHQDHTDKWQNAVQNLKSCFPFARDLNFSEAQSASASPSTSHYDGINNGNETIIRNAIHQIANDALSLSRNNNNNNNNNDSSILSVYSNHLSLLDAYMDRYYDIYREYFAMDESCCKLRPTKDEIVLHVRLFTQEMPRKGVIKGYEELSPKDLVEQALSSPLFNNTTSANNNNNNNNKKNIALVSRYTDHLDDYVSTLEQAGWNVRVIVNQTATQDFCFLRHAKVLIGSVRSTFFWWAAVLSASSASSSSNDNNDDNDNDDGNSTTPVTVLAYSMDSPAKQQWAISHNTSVLETYPFRNPAIRAKFQFPLYKASHHREP